MEMPEFDSFPVIEEDQDANFVTSCRELRFFSCLILILSIYT